MHEIRAAMIVGVEAAILDTVRVGDRYIHGYVRHRPPVLVHNAHRAAHVGLIAFRIVAGLDGPRVRVHAGSLRIRWDVFTIQDARSDCVVSDLEGCEPDLSGLLRRDMNPVRIELDLRSASFEQYVGFNVTRNSEVPALVALPDLRACNLHGWICTLLGRPIALSTGILRHKLIIPLGKIFRPDIDAL